MSNICYDFEEMYIVNKDYGYTALFCESLLYVTTLFILTCVSFYYICINENIERNNNAILIQSIYRGYMARRSLKTKRSVHPCNNIRWVVDYADYRSLCTLTNEYINKGELRITKIMTCSNGLLGNTSWYKPSAILDNYIYVRPSINDISDLEFENLDDFNEKDKEFIKHLMNPDEILKYHVDYAKTSCSKCNYTQEFIEKDELRFGHEVRVPSEPHNTMIRWYKFNTPVARDMIRDQHTLHGFAELDNFDQQRIIYSNDHIN